MAERTIKHVFYNYIDEDGVGRTAQRGQTVDLSEQEIARGDAGDAFEETDPNDVQNTNALEGAFGADDEVDPETGVPHEGDLDPVEDDPGPGAEPPPDDAGTQPESTSQVWRERLDEETTASQSGTTGTSGSSAEQGQIGAGEAPSEPAAETEAPPEPAQTPPSPSEPAVEPAPEPVPPASPSEPPPEPAPAPDQSLPESEHPDGTEVQPLSNEEIDGLSGAELDQACEDAGVDTETGGSLAGGRKSADEKRAALKVASSG